MIASNYRRHPDAMALQLVLAFSRRFTWHTSRPTTRLGRAHRAAVAAAFKAAGLVRYPEAKKTPSWASLATAAARRLARAVKTACMGLPFDELERLERTYASKSLSPYARHIAKCKMARAAEMAKQAK